MKEATTSHQPGTSPERGSQMATTTHTNQDPRLFAEGTTTEWGTLDRQTLTGWFMTSGEFVPFTTMQGRHFVSPLVQFG